MHINSISKSSINKLDELDHNINYKFQEILRLIRSNNITEKEITLLMRLTDEVQVDFSHFKSVAFGLININFYKN